MILDVWLYGELRKYSDTPNKIGYGQMTLEVPEGYRMRDLLERLNMPTSARGITFVNGNLSALPGFQPDLDHVFSNNDRVAMFDLRSMWPFQYRHGAAMIEEMQQAMIDGKDQGVHHAYNSKE